jgi:glycosyltransferase involved in cell wall biosynthesis
MNVLFLTHNFPRFAGDHAGAFVLRLATALRDRGVGVHVVAPVSRNGSVEGSIDGITVDRFRYAPRRFESLAYTGNMAGDVAQSWTARFALLGFLGADFAAAVRARRQYLPDVIHAHWWFPAGLVGTWTSALGHVPLVTTLHGTDVRLARRLMMARPLFRHVLRHSAAVTAVSSWLSSLTASLAHAAAPVVAPMPVATELFSARNGGADRQGLLFVGRLTPQKGLAHLLRAMSKMRNHAPLDVVGDGAIASELRRLADSLGVADRVRWHGTLPQDQLPERYRRAQVVVVPSVEEGLGMVAIEAALCETPTVAFASGGLRDSVRDGATGVLVREEDDDALAAALDQVLEAPDRARELGRAARLFALANFAPESTAQKYVTIYEQAVGRGQP